VSLDGLPALHLKALLDGLPVFERYGLLLAGGYAFRAHEILHRPSQVGLENLARRHDLDLEAILDHLAGVSVFADDDFAGYGLGDASIADLRRWAVDWYDDLSHRLAAERIDDNLPGGFQPGGMRS
jgi:hypothetical protein